MTSKERHDWYVVKTVSGSQKPQRTYHVEKTRSRKGYRVNARLNPDVSAVERALEQAGYSYYMPAEKRLVRDRKHTAIWKPRRFALLVGYVFICNPDDFRRLEDVEGVSHVVKDAGGVPLRIDIMDILKLRQVEAWSESLFDIQSERARKTVRLRAKRDPRLQSLVRKLALINEATIPMEKGILAA